MRFGRWASRENGWWSECVISRLDREGWDVSFPDEFDDFLSSPLSPKFGSRNENSLVLGGLFMYDMYSIL